MKAILEKIEAETTYIIRVFDDDKDYGDPYKFFTVVEVNGVNAEIKGMSNSKITSQDRKAIFKQLKLIGVESITWTHKGKLVKSMI